MKLSMNKLNEILRDLLFWPLPKKKKKENGRLPIVMMTNADYPLRKGNNSELCMNLQNAVTGSYLRARPLTNPVQIIRDII